MKILKKSIFGIPMHVFTVILLSGLLATLLYGCQNKPLYKETQLHLGTFVEVTSSNKSASRIVFAHIKELETIFNKFDPQSEVSRLNKLGALKVSNELIKIIERAKYFHQISNGAFDITVSPLVDLWKHAIKTKELPSESQINKAKNLIGMDNISIDRNDYVIKFTKKGLNIDLGAIAKGYAVDEAIEELKKSGINDALINAGGQIYCLGTNNGRPWNIGIQDPRDSSKILGYLKLVDRAVATSGNYQQYFILNHRHYSHIIDPRTGYPADNKIASVTVIAPDGTTADALSTAIFVLGKVRGETLAKKFKDIEVQIKTTDDVQNN
ncbi:MAG: FAD:protein FMN transferase [Candidatus Omnitrophota bacterium]